MFPITLSLLKKLHEFLHMMGALTIFEKIYLMFNIVDNGLVTKLLGAGCTFDEVAEKTNCQKMNVNFLQPNY
jgi:hypothetical protein